jgi:hypothetical protein
MTLIEAINDILGAVGETPIDSSDADYQSHPQYQSASRVLAAIHAREASRGWWFNTDAAAPYGATTVAFEATPEAYAAYVVAMAQVRYLKSYDGDEAKIKFYTEEAGLSATSLVAEHLRNVLIGLDSSVAAAVSAVFAATQEAPGSGQQALLLVGANRVEVLAAQAIAEVDAREQAQGWWFNTADGVVTPVALATAPAAFREWVNALAAMRVAKVYNAAESKVTQLREEATRAAIIVLTMHLNATLDALDSRMAAAVSSLVRVAETVNGGTDSPLYRSMAMVGANRIDRVVAKALAEVNQRDQAPGWWFNTDADGVITVVALADAAVPDTFREWVTASAAVRVAEVYGAPQTKVQQLQEGAINARLLFMREHIRESAVNLRDTPAVIAGLQWWNTRYRSRG